MKQDDCWSHKLQEFMASSFTCKSFQRDLSDKQNGTALNPHGPDNSSAWWHHTAQPPTKRNLSSTANQASPQQIKLVFNDDE